MDEQLTKGLIETFLRFKRIKIPLPPKTDGGKRELGVIETVLLKKISEGNIGCFGDLEEECRVSKSAVSQMLGALEEKGYLTRELDKTNRRKRLLALTPKGRETLDTIGKEMDACFAEVIQRFGEDDTRRLVSLFNRFAAIIEECKE